MASGDITTVVVQLTDGLASINTQVKAIMNAKTDLLMCTWTGAPGEFLYTAVEET